MHKGLLSGLGLYMSLGAISLFMTLRPTHLLPTVATSPFHVDRSPIFLWDLRKTIIDTRQPGNPSSRTGLGVAKWALRGSLLGSFLERFSSVTSRAPGKTAPLLAPDLSCLSVMPGRAAVIWKPCWKAAWGQSPAWGWHSEQRHLHLIKQKGYCCALFLDIQGLLTLNTFALSQLSWDDNHSCYNSLIMTHFVIKCNDGESISSD